MAYKFVRVSRPLELVMHPRNSVTPTSCNCACVCVCVLLLFAMFAMLFFSASRSLSSYILVSTDAANNGHTLAVVAARALASICLSCKAVLAKTRGYILKLAKSVDKAAEAGIAKDARVELAQAVGTLITAYGSPILSKASAASKGSSAHDRGETAAAASNHVAKLIALCVSQNCTRLQRFVASKGKGGGAGGIGAGSSPAPPPSPTTSSASSMSMSMSLSKSISPVAMAANRAVAGELACLTELVRWLQFSNCGRNDSSSPTHPLIHVLSKFWPVLEGLQRHFLDAKDIMRELCEL